MIQCQNSDHDAFFPFFVVETLGVKLTHTQTQKTETQIFTQKVSNNFVFTSVHSQLPGTEESEQWTNAKQNKARIKNFFTFLYGCVPACRLLNDSRQLQKYNNHFLFFATVTTVTREQRVDRTLLFLSISQFSISNRLNNFNFSIVDNQITSEFSVQCSCFFTNCFAYSLFHCSTENWNWWHKKWIKVSFEIDPKASPVIPFSITLWELFSIRFHFLLALF